MRRKISLYIGDSLVDLDDQSIILFNYTQEDLSNPTIVRNSFSQQVSLKGTPNNNQIFGYYFRVDREVDFNGGDSGSGFNPSKKTPFSIYNEMDEILESGYCKLDEVVRNGVDITYKVSLYGGLGSFLFSLSYDESGNKRTLADLDYLGNGDPGELDFVIDKTNLERAWEDLMDLYYGAEPTPTGKWTVINFAPAYNGLPDNFSPDKGIISLPGAGLPESVGGYSSKNGYGLVNLSNSVDEWAAKDIRTYLQRPVLSVKRLWEAICNPNNNGGYTVDISSLSFPYYDLWLTLPTIPSLGSMKQSSGGLSVSSSSSPSTGNNIGRWDISGDVPYGAVVNGTLRCKLRYNMPSGANSYNTLSLVGNNNSGNTVSSVVFLQVVAYASDNTMVGGSKVKMIGGVTTDARGAATSCGFTPPFPTDEYEYFNVGNATKISSGVFELQNELTFKVEAQDVAYYVLNAYVYTCNGTLIRGVWHHSFSGNGSSSRVTLYASYTTYYQATNSFFLDGSGNTVTMTTPDSLRSGATITKQMLLSTSGTPAEYLLSLCKIFGLYFVTDTATKKVTILRRNDLYVNETIDLTDRVDVSKDRTVVPLLFDSKWYRFSLEGVGGAFFDEYKNIEGVEYGIQLIDTGFDFNAEVKDLLDNSVLKNACTILQRSRYWNIITSGNTFLPSPFLDTGNTITRWNSSDESQDTPIPTPPSTSTVTYYNNTFNGYDIENRCKVEFSDKDGKMVDGKNVLLFLNGFATYDSFKITDDLPVMSVVNGGKPCWILDEGEGVDLPIFSRYRYQWGLTDLEMVTSLDFGVPRQLDIPGIVYNPETTVYYKAWRNYLRDRYDVDTKVMRCWVHFDKIQVNQSLLRKFYYYENTLWVLNRIINHSLTTYDPVECEFIQVQDKSNYLTGQDY